MPRSRSKKNTPPAEDMPASVATMEPNNDADESESLLIDEQIAAGEIVPLSKVPRQKRDTYISGMIDDLPRFRKAIATVEFFPLLKMIPPALWEKRLIVYLYRTFPKVKNAPGDKNFIEKIARPFDQEYIKGEHGGGGYLCYLNLDSEENLKQVSFSIDGLPKFIAGQSFVDGNGNVIAPATNGAIVPPAGQGKSDIAEAIGATSDATRAGFELLAEASKTGLEMQRNIFEKAAGIGANGAGGSESLAEKLLLKMFDKQGAQNDPMETALSLMDKLDGMIARRLPKDTEERHHNPTGITELNETVGALTGGKTLSELITSTGGNGRVDMLTIIAQAGAKLVENLPAILAHVSNMRDQSFRQQLTLAQLRGGQPAALPPGAPAPAAPAMTAVPGQIPGGPRVAAPPAVTYSTPGNGAAAVTEFPQPTPGPAVVDLTAADPAALIPAMVQIIKAKFSEGYAGGAVAQTIDVMCPGVIEMIAPMVLDERELDKFLAGIPDLATLTLNPDWPEFRAEFVEFVKDESAEAATGNEGKQTVMKAATA